MVKLELSILMNQKNYSQNNKFYNFNNLELIKYDNNKLYFININKKQNKIIEISYSNFLNIFDFTFQILENYYSNYNFNSNSKFNLNKINNFEQVLINSQVRNYLLSMEERMFNWKNQLGIIN